MAWSSPDSWVTRLFSGDPLAILISLVVTLALPTLLHWYFYTTSARTVQTPTFLLLGPSNSGKTSLLALLQHRTSSSPSENGTAPAPTTTAPQTRTTQIASRATLRLPPTVSLGSNKYRSSNDFEVADSKTRAIRYNLVDTPGHGKLRTAQALSHLDSPSLHGVIFVVDSAALDSSIDLGTNSGGEDAARDAAVYLHDALLTLQRRKAKAKSSSSTTDFHVLIAANKQDLFTALPPSTIKSKLQDEIEKVKKSRSRGVRSVDVDPDKDEDDETNVLGGIGEDKFSFKMLEEEFGIVVEVAGGAVRGDEAGKGVRAWEEWIGSCL